MVAQLAVLSLSPAPSLEKSSLLNLLERLPVALLMLRPKPAMASKGLPPPMPRLGIPEPATVCPPDPEPMPGTPLPRPAPMASKPLSKSLPPGPPPVNMLPCRGPVFSRIAGLLCAAAAAALGLNVSSSGNGRPRVLGSRRELASFPLHSSTLGEELVVGLLAAGAGVSRDLPFGFSEGLVESCKFVVRSSNLLIEKRRPVHTS